MEIERKFLVERVPDELQAQLRDAAAIEQGYLALEPVEVRLRRIDERTLLTAKSGSGLVRDEAEVEIAAGAFDALWPLTAERRLRKRRRELDDSGVTLELDFYEGDLDGLITAEAEFESEAAASEYEPPRWLGRELTGDSRFSNAALAIDGLPGD